MKKLNMDTKMEVIKTAAKEFGIKWVGVKKEEVINQINEKIEEKLKSEKVQEPKKSNKWYEQENAFPFTEGSLAFITSHKNQAIIGRMVEIIGPSTKKNAIRGFLINPKTGARQNTCLSLDFDMVTEHTPQYPVLVNSNVPMVI